MIFPVSAINFNQKKTENANKTYILKSVLSRDSFELQNNFVPSFSGLDFKKLAGYCKELEQAVGTIKTQEQGSNIFQDFCKKYNDIIAPENATERDYKISEIFTHEINKFTGEIFPLMDDNGEFFKFGKGDDFNPEKVVDYQKELLTTLAVSLKRSSLNWVILQKWMTEGKPIAFSKVFALIKQIPKNSGYKGLMEIEGEDLLKDKSVQNPYELYAYVSQLFLNVKKHGNDTPFKVKFEKILEQGKDAYYISVINKTREPITREHLEGILEGKASSGKGLKKISATLKRNGFKLEEIYKMFNYNNETGIFSARIPLLGISNKTTAV